MNIIAKGAAAVLAAAMFAGIGAGVAAANTPSTAAQPVADAAATTADAGSSGPFVHPGVVVGTNQLSFVKQKLATNSAPWTTFYAQMLQAKAGVGTNGQWISRTVKGSFIPYVSADYQPHPATVSKCPSGNYLDAPVECADEVDDAIAAYANALVYYYDHNLGTTRDSYGQRAVKILNAWSDPKTGLRTRIFNGPGDSSASNAQLEASWSGSVFAKAAELVRYTYTPPANETGLNVANMTDMLNAAFVPFVNLVQTGGGPNWLMSMDEATANIGIFENNRTLYNNAISRWKAEIPGIIYQQGDVNAYPNLKGLPLAIPGTIYDNAKTTAATFQTFWWKPSSYPNGLEAETCRDPAHMAMGYGAMTNLAETARLQGDDLYNYGDVKKRITSSLELSNGFVIKALGGTAPVSSPSVCSKVDPVNNTYWKATFEIAYNEYANREGVSLPNTAALLEKYIRPASSGNKASDGMDFEGLTSYGTP